MLVSGAKNSSSAEPEGEKEPTKPPPSRTKKLEPEAVHAFFDETSAPTTSVYRPGSSCATTSASSQARPSPSARR